MCRMQRYLGSVGFVTKLFATARRSLVVLLIMTDKLLSAKMKPYSERGGKELITLQVSQAQDYS